MANFVSVPSDNNFKKRNLLLVVKVYWFTWIIFHFTIVYFFWLFLDSILLVWIFLWFWNLIALLSDVPIWVIQKYFKPKKLLIFANILMIFVTLIFFKFIFFSSLWEVTSSTIAGDSEIISNLTIFFENWFNLLLLLLTAFLYWIIKETYDITFLSYILGGATPSEYASNLSKYNISFWVWALIWIIISWFILALAIEIAIIIVFFIIIIFLFLIVKYFDREENTIDFSKIKNLSVTSIKWWIDKSKIYMVETVKKVEVKEIIKNTRYVFLIPIEIKKELNMEELKETTILSFKSVFNVILGENKSMILIWSMTVMLFFGFWDTFVSTFQIEFLNKIISLNSSSAIISNTKWLITWYVLIWLLVIPIFLSQQFFINKSKTKGVFNIISFGVLLSALSIIFFGISQNIIFVLIFWLLNSFWYAAAMPLAMATFSERYNIEYAKKYNLKEIESNSSAAPLKILINLANVFWLVIWWLLVSILWFNWFFMVLWLSLFILLSISILNKNLITKEEE